MITLYWSSCFHQEWSDWLCASQSFQRNEINYVELSRIYFKYLRLLLILIPMFGSLMKPQSVSALQVFSTEITVKSRVILNVGSLYVPADVCFAGGGFPADGAMPQLFNFVHH